MTEEGASLVRRIEPVRMLGFVCLATLSGCGIIGNEPLRVDTFTSDPGGTFVYAAQTNTVMTENDDGEAEQIRYDWLAEELSAHGMCGAGYVVETRLLEPVEAPLNNAHDVVYRGRCL